MVKNVFTLPYESSTISLGFKIGRFVKPGCLIYLCGKIGSGKTSFCRGFLRSLGYIGHVRSPTYTLIESYALDLYTVHHFDFYRIANYSSFESAGLRDYFNNYYICLVEWSENGNNFLPKADIKIMLSYIKFGRKAIIDAFSVLGINILKSIQEKHDKDSC